MDRAAIFLKKLLHFYARVFTNTLIILALAAGCSVRSASPWPGARQPDYWPTQDWRSSTPEEQGMDSDMLAQMFESIQIQGTRLHSILIIRNGYLVLEAYFQPYRAQDLHEVASNTKSVIGALTGIAIDQGIIQSVDQPVLDFFPGRFIQNMDSRKEAMTLEHLLSLNTGLNCEDNTPPASDMYQTQGWVQFMLDLPMVEEPGGKWRYCSGAVHLLSAILQKTSGMDARSFANQQLFQPLGIPEVVDKDWSTDPQGYSLGIAGLHLTPRDLAKFGYLYLHKGNWDGRQVVPADWVEESTREHAYIGKDAYAGGQDRRFGYLWSIFPDEGYYGYLGMAGQGTWIIPEKNMVVVFTAGLEVGKEAVLLNLLNGYILPSARSASPLPVNQDSKSRLDSLVQQAAGLKQESPRLPSTAFEISGKVYQLEENPLGWQAMNFQFQEGSGEALLDLNGEQVYIAGMDHLFRMNDIPGSRPIAVRGHWQSHNELLIEYLVLGDFMDMQALVRFDGNKIELSVTNNNFPSEPTMIHGIAQ